MDAPHSALSLLVAMLLFTTFIKTATVLSIARYGLGLVGFEFGAVCLMVAVGMAWVSSPPELTALGFPEVMFSRSQSIQPQAVTQALLPYMERRIDPGIATHFLTPQSEQTEGQEPADAVKPRATLRTVVPAYILSELKAAFQLGCMILIPLVMVDLLVAHVLALVGVQNIAAAAVALPLKLILFITAGGWGLLGKKIIGLE
jgi:type III secretory pathway component EscR